MSIVITGNPGVGKHTISKEVCKILKLPLIDINEIARKFQLLEKIGETNDVDVEKLAKLLKKEIKQNSIIVGHLAPYVLNSNQISKIIVLRKNPYDLIPVYQRRKYSKDKIKENIGSEALGIIFYDSISKFGPEKTLQIDITSQKVEDSVKKTIAIIQDEIQSDQVDWLQEISERNDLSQFFAYWLNNA